MKITAFTPYAITLNETALRYIPASMREHIEAGGRLWIVAQPERGRAFISTHKDCCGHICTFVSESDILND